MKIKVEIVKLMKEKYSKIKNIIDKKEINDALIELNEIPEHLRNENYFVLLSEIYVIKKEYDEAILILKKGLQQIINSYILYYKMYEIFWMQKKYEESLLSLAKSGHLKSNQEESDRILEEIKALIPKLYDLIGEEKARIIVRNSMYILGEGDERAFPMDKYGESWINRALIDSKGNKYIVNLYKGFLAENVNENVRFYLKTEFVKGNKHKYKKLKITEKSVLPITAEFGEKIEVKLDKNIHYSFTEENMQKNRINYIQLEPGEYTLKSKADFFVGNPIKQLKTSSKQCIVIYIDGLSQVFLEEHGLEKLMPNTFNYFKDGYWNQNCYTTSDWTFPSVTSIHTGLTLFNHKVYHPNINIDINKISDLFTNQFKERGFYTTQINNNWRITPSYGYMEGYDRGIYQHFRGGFGIGEVLAEGIEHLSSFENNNHFVWLGIEDLHDIADGFNHDLYQQLNLSLEERMRSTKTSISVNAEYSEDRIVKYKNQLYRIDIYLGMLYKFLEKKYHSEDLYVSIISDHGQGYIKESDNFLHDGRRKVPFLIKGPNVPNKVSNELMSITDYFPNLLTLIDGRPFEIDNTIDFTILHDFGGEKRQIVITETLHPSHPYHIVITSDTHIFDLKTVQAIERNGLLHFDEIEVQLIDQQTNQDITESEFEEVVKYVDFVEKRVLHYQYIEL